ncbi:DNA repair protein RecO [Lysobacter pythonis]|uniref:DNA repair protein RecO n=1 Tax=Solilutibacter pythonis TaxID=2483112 RepID=A0A3M2HF25_9GAMM|nr:recombination protein O N-terminal domain-containing protein [Lysobacter pythonis]RMH88346.1 DNA repair protein RecO [Lysobacter pythonis]
MRISSQAAFVLHARAWRETSLLVEALCAEHGRIGLVARGVSTPRRHALRAALQPLQCVRLEAVQRGELATLQVAEAIDGAPRPSGDAALAAFYLNELTLRLTPRLDPLPELHAAYARTRRDLGGAAASLPWSLRRYERDLLDAIGFGFDWAHDGDGEPIDPAARYRLDPEHGPRRLLRDRGSEDRRDTATGAALLALAADHRPGDDDLASLRRPMRALLARHLGARGLKSWEMAAQLRRLHAGGGAGRE